MLQNTTLTGKEVAAYTTKFDEAKGAIAGAAVETANLKIETELMTGIQNTRCRRLYKYVYGNDRWIKVFRRKYERV